MKQRSANWVWFLSLATVCAIGCREHLHPPSPVRRTGEDLEARPLSPAESAESPVPWKPPIPRGAAERREERERMVREQIAEPRDGRVPVRDPRVLEAMRTVPRHAFVPKSYSREAYADYPLPIGSGQTISQPYIVALMTEALRLSPESKVLEIGTGSGYQAAVLAHLTPHVYTIEIVEELARRARAALDEQGYTQVRVRHGDGFEGWKENAPFDAIIVTCAPDSLPQPLWEQLKPGGRIVIPIGSPSDIQRLVVVRKTESGERRTEEVTLVRFVPLVRDPKLKAKDLSPKAEKDSARGAPEMDREH